MHTKGRLPPVSLPQTLRRLSLPLPLAVAAAAQSTLVVNAAGGPGVFTTLPAAVAAAVDGDTILVYTGPFGEGADPFVTNKGITIVGVGGFVPFTSSALMPFEVSGLPAGRAFRMAGFSRVSNGELNFRIFNCAGSVHLESMQVREPDLFPPIGPAIEIVNSASVTLRAVGTFGAPAVRTFASRVVLTDCRLGVSYLGLGGGLCLEVINATVDIVEPRFDAGPGPVAIQASNAVLSIAGAGAAVIRAVGPFAPVVVNGGSLTVDPAVPILGGLGGSTAATFRTLPASRTNMAALAGSPLALQSRADTGWLIAQAIGSPGALVASPLGTLGIDASLPYVLLPPQVPSSNTYITDTLFLPAGLPRGLPIASQSVVWTGVALELGVPVTAVVQ